MHDLETGETIPLHPWISAIDLQIDKSLNNAAEDNSMFFHFLRSLELALLERGEHLPDLAEDVAPRLRVKPLVTKTATVPAPLPVEWLEQEQQSGSKQGKPRSQKQAPPPPPQGQVTVPPMESAKPQADTDKDNAAADSSSSASEGDTETAEAKAAQRKVDAAALDAVYELCAAPLACC